MEVALTHEHADFDAIASLVGLARLRPSIRPVLPMVVNRNVLDFLTLYGGELTLEERDALPSRPISRVWIVDSTSAQMVKGTQPETPRSIIDHHTDEPPPVGENVEIEVEPVGATVTLVVERIAAAGIPLPRVEATLLLLGIYEDTGHLTYSGTTPRDLRAAAWLLETGADLETARRFLVEAFSDSSYQLLDDLARNADIHRVRGHGVAVAYAKARDFDEEIAPVVTRLLDRLPADALFGVVDLDGHVQVVARSRSDAVDVGAVAEQLGGGGHSRAAAAVVEDGSASATVARIIELLPEHVRPAHRVGEIMTWGAVLSIAADADIATAREQAERHGHEGFPVVDDTRVIGVVTRQELDRAHRHGMGKESVLRLVSAPPPPVHPDTPIEELQAIMLESRLGQLPVVVDSRLVGIVTRTDLLKQLAGTSRSSPGRTRLSLRERFEPDVWRAVEAVSAEAAGLGMRAYLVGGVPRDLLLGKPPGHDVDVVVEGDAISLARRIAQKHGGAVATHHRFGTAKWTPAESDRAVKPVAIDFVTARTEFYAAPTELPGVERGSLKSDLRRRDFTINTLAITLGTNPERAGLVVDLFGGLEDLGAGRIRVLHSLSFVEDPTRILRAVRFAERLDFDIEPRTAHHMRNAVYLLRKVSAARIRNELLQLFAEPSPAAVVDELAQLGALGAMDPAFSRVEALDQVLGALPAGWDRWRTVKPDLHLDETPSTEEKMLVWLALQPERDAVIRRLKLSRRHEAACRAVARVASGDGVVGEPRPDPVQLYDALEAVDGRHLVLAWCVSALREVRANVRWYLEDLIERQPQLDGAQVLELGVTAGPRVGQILRAVHEERLHGRLAGIADEIDYARRLLARDPGHVQEQSGKRG